ncbi:hypothetical protein D7Z26_02385 [Cohnella endophytica]|uniref:Uncharacterized protein n=1 Tax=Cohnella endophytica TaxID=2419778 RepID=A0A494Y966_9BACL|nr:hypothetical protein [Cohnella endophytica]RKP56858.1 hypothetical protein D7Z26_02385 [Cohnella endophytica]
MFYHDHDLKELSRQRQAEWETRIRQSSAKKDSEPKANVTPNNSQAVNKKQKKGCSIPSPAINP